MSGITLDELLKEVGISPEQLNETCTIDHLLNIALFLTSWRTLAPHLQLSSGEVEVVDVDAHGEKERRQMCLKLWKDKFAYRATYRVLVEALMKIGNADQAKEVCRLLESQQPSKDMSKFKCLLLLLNEIGYFNYTVVTLHGCRQDKLKRQ